MKETAGLKGEQSVDYPLSFISEKNFFILHDIRLQYQRHYFQIDTLVISPFFFLILEINNMVGTLFFDSEFRQLIRTYEGREEVFQDPCIQLFLQELQFQQWLLNQKAPVIPIHSLVVSSNPKAIIKTTPDNTQIIEKVVRGDVLPFKFEQFQEVYYEEVIPLKELKRLAELLQTHHTPADPTILGQFKMEKELLLTGIFCPRCDHIPMRRVHGNWFCPSCQLKDKDAHISALKDYALLIESTITNREAQEFLQLPNSSTMTKLLKSMQLPCFEVNKGKTYSLVFEDE